MCSSLYDEGRIDTIYYFLSLLSMIIIITNGVGIHTISNREGGGGGGEGEGEGE